MKKYLFYIITLMFFLIISCERKEPEKQYVYFLTKSLKVDSLDNKPAKYKAFIISDSIKLYDELNDLIIKTKYKTSDEGISVQKNGKFFLIYPFKDSLVIDRNIELIPPFFKNVRLVGKKNYRVKGEIKTVYHFVENGFDETLDSYYLDGEGFICFYKYSEDSFLYLDSPAAIEISSQFLTDSSFFAMLKMREVDRIMGRKTK